MADLDFEVSPLEYQILNARFQSPEKLVTIPDNADNNPRFAVIYADVAGNVGYILGDSAENPAIPLVNPSTQIAVTTVYIAALGTVPAPDPDGETAEITTTVIYNEGTEWPPGKTEEAGITIGLTDETEPATGAKHVKMVVAGGAGSLERAALLSSAAAVDGHFFPVAVVGNTFTRSLSALFPDHKTSVDSASLRHVVFYNILRRQDITAELKNLDTQVKTAVQLSAFTTEVFNEVGSGFSANVPAVLTLTTKGNVQPGDYNLTLTGFVRNDQQYNILAAPIVQPAAAAISFTAAEAVAAKGGKLSMSLKSTVAWLASTGLIIELYNAAARVGSMAFLPGSLYGFNASNDDYQRVTIPISAFNPTADQITAVKIRPVNAWPNGSLYIDNVTLQTGVQAEPEADKYVDAVELDENGLFTVKQTGNVPDKSVQFAKAAKTGSYNDLSEKPAIPTVGTIAAKNFWTGTEAAYTAVDRKSVV